MHLLGSTGEALPDAVGEGDLVQLPGAGVAGRGGQVVDHVPGRPGDHLRHLRVLLPGEEGPGAGGRVHQEELAGPVPQRGSGQDRQEPGDNRVIFWIELKGSSPAIPRGRVEDGLELVVHPTVPLWHDEDLPAGAGCVLEGAQRHCGQVLHAVHPVDGDGVVVGPGDGGEMGVGALQARRRRQGVLADRALRGPNLRAKIDLDQMCMTILCSNGRRVLSWRPPEPP